MDAGAQAHDVQQRLKETEQALEKTLEEMARLGRKLEEQRAQRNALRLQLQEALQKPAQAAPASDKEESKPVEKVAGQSPAAGAAASGRPLELTHEQRLAQLKHSELLQKSKLFDAEWYLATYPDVKSDKKYSQAPHEHYLMYGGFEGRNPCSTFQSAFYLAQYPDVAAGKVNPLVHYLLHGEKEGRRAAPKGSDPTPGV
uniref:hypothetical protein n=1 Tax=uncultured Halomonas sp. TaxID=173971 RepID=UPI002620D08B|nr:hypothetical protein [uncultured Halomonas sp.]